MVEESMWVSEYSGSRSMRDSPRTHHCWNQLPIETASQAEWIWSLPESIQTVAYSRILSHFFGLYSSPGQSCWCRDWNRMNSETSLADQLGHSVTDNHQTSRTYYRWQYPYRLLMRPPIHRLLGAVNYCREHRHRNNHSRVALLAPKSLGNHQCCYSRLLLVHRR